MNSLSEFLHLDSGKTGVNVFEEFSNDGQSGHMVSWVPKVLEQVTGHALSSKAVWVTCFHVDADGVFCVSVLPLLLLLH